MLKTPLTWIKDLSLDTRLDLLAKYGSLKALAAKFSCSEAALRPIYMGEPLRDLDWDEEFVIAQFERYRSVQLVAHMNDVPESHVRRRVEALELEITDLIDYSFGGNSNAKGRRAELDYAKLRGELVQADRNLLDGSQAKYDFDDVQYGQVNVKSSRAYRYTAQTRKADPIFWKISTSGWEMADALVCMCYDAKMTTLVGIVVLNAKQASHTKTVTLTSKDLTAPDGLRTCNFNSAPRGSPQAGNS